MQRYFLLFLIATMLVACSDPQLERPDVPMLWGMRLNEPADAAQLNPNLAKLRELVMRSLLLELPLKADSTGLPKAMVDVPTELTGLLSRYRNHIHLAFCNTQEAELFPSGKPSDMNAWFAALRKEIVRNVDLLQGTLPDRVIVGGELLQVADQSEAWTQLLAGLRAQYPGILFSIGGHTESFENSKLAAISDELAIDYAPMAGAELKAESRTENQRIAALAAQHDKPVFIYRANLLGEEQLLQLKNRLRFWPAEVKLTGLCINSLYASIAARDDHTYYGLADDAEVMAYLDAYRRAAAE
jgi:hypothetical protein